MVSQDYTRRRLDDVRGFIGGLYGPDLHAKRVDALAAATLGVMAGASLAVAMIGQALAQARGLVTKHAVKQVDRLMSNAGIDVWDSFARWVPQQVGARPDILVAMDWTDFDHDGQSTLVLSLVTGHGRAAPLIWLTVWKEEIATRRNDYEDACLRRLAETMPAGCRVTILADRGFGDQKLFAFLATLGFGYVIRFRGNIRVTDATGETKPAVDWVGKAGRARKLRDARVTALSMPVEFWFSRTSRAVVSYSKAHSVDLARVYLPLSSLRRGLPTTLCKPRLFQAFSGVYVTHKRNDSTGSAGEPEFSPEAPIENSPLCCASITSVSAWRFDGGEVVELQVDDGLQGFGGGGVAEPIG